MSNPYSNIRPLSEPDLYTAMYNFALAFGKPDLQPGNIIRGWENRSYLPPQTNEYAVVTPMLSARRGTNVTLPPDAEGNITIAELKQCTVQFDFCADNETAKQRAETVELVSRDPIAAAFLEPYGITPLYADDAHDMSFVDGSDQFVQRFNVTLYISFWAKLDATVSYFTNAHLYFENVDVHHLPQEEQ